MSRPPLCFFFFFFNDTATTEIYTLSLHDALPISTDSAAARRRSRSESLMRRSTSYRATISGHDGASSNIAGCPSTGRSEEHTSELQSPCNLVCRLLLEKKKKKIEPHTTNVLAHPN